MKKAGLVLLMFGLLFGCSRTLEVVPESVKGDLLMVQDGNSKNSEAVIVAMISGQNIYPAKSPGQLKSYFAYITPNQINDLSFEKVQLDYYMRGNDGTTNYYFDLALMGNSLYLLNTYSGCSGCGFCVMTSASTCSCNESSGSCSYNSGSVK